MRVLHINCNYLGTTLHQCMIEHLNDLGIDSQVFVPTYNKNSAVIKINDNVYVSECFRKIDRCVFDYKQHKIKKSLEIQVNVSNYDLIHAYTLFTDGNCARNISIKYGIPYVVAVRNTDVNSFFKLRPFLRNRGVQIMRDAAAIFFLSDSYRKQVFNKYVPVTYQKELLEKTYIIPNGIDDFWIENVPALEKPINLKHIKLIYAGRIDKNKNIQMTQKAMDILYNKGYSTSLKVVGKIQDRKEYETIIENKYTTYIPPVSKEKLIDLYRDSDIFVMPSKTESFGLVYAEAMSQGLPVIYSKGQGFDNQFPEGRVGYHVNSDDPESVADGIKRVIDNYYDIQHCVTSFAGDFCWEKIVKKYSQIYTKIVPKIDNS